MITRQTTILAFALFLSGCGHKEPPAPTAPARVEKVSIENQTASPEAPPPAAAPNQPPPAAETPPLADAGDPTSSEAKKRYVRNMNWVQELKYGDEKKKQETAAAIKHANLSASERAEFDQLRAHYNIQYPVAY